MPFLEYLQSDPQGDSIADGCDQEETSPELLYGAKNENPILDSSVPRGQGGAVRS